MSHFAYVPVIENNVGIVQNVIVIEQDVINTGLFGVPSAFYQTSFNTYGGKHLLGGKPLRKNFAGIGFTLDLNRDAFIPPKVYQSWVLNEETCLWEAPISMPDDGKTYQWNELNVAWVLAPAESK
jgi:hypothetical protein